MADEEALLIAGFSGRALAASARRAGYVPLVVDAFGDTDTRLYAEAVEVIPEAYARGFRAGPLLAALGRLCVRAPRGAPLGLVLAAGFEDCPRLVAELERRFPVLGCGAEAIAATKDPRRFFPLLGELGIAHPETRLDPPADGRGWLTKRIGGVGGTHIARCRSRVAAHADRYFQREMRGEAVSMLGVVGASAAFAFSRQWAAPMPRRPFRYGGGVGNIAIDPDLEARLIGIGLDVSKALRLRGLVSFDFIVADGEPLLLEVNPRPGASIDLLDDEHGTLTRAHVAACRSGDPAAVLASHWKPATRAAGYLYADRGATTIPVVDWPEWVADRPAAGTTIPRYGPIATVIADGEDETSACERLAERLGALARVL